MFISNKVFFITLGFLLALAGQSSFACGRRYTPPGHTSPNRSPAVYTIYSVTLENNEVVYCRSRNTINGFVVEPGPLNKVGNGQNKSVSSVEGLYKLDKSIRLISSQTKNKCNKKKRSKTLKRMCKKQANYIARRKALVVSINKKIEACKRH